jgi:hypothetical protein
MNLLIISCVNAIILKPYGDLSLMTLNCLNMTPLYHLEGPVDWVILLSTSGNKAH